MPYVTQVGLATKFFFVFSNCFVMMSFVIVCLLDLADANLLTEKERSEMTCFYFEWDFKPCQSFGHF